MIVHGITLDMQQPGRSVILHAPKGEKEARQVQITLVDNGLPWPSPVNAEISVAYKRKNGTGGHYDKLADGTTPAVTLNAARTVATVTLTKDVLAYAGPVEMNLSFQLESQRTITASWIFVVDELGGTSGQAHSPSPGADVTLIPAGGSVQEDGEIVFQNSDGDDLFSVQLPLYDGEIEALEETE